MRTALWIGIILFLTAIAFWIVNGPWYPHSSIALFFTCAFFAAPGIGGLWMLFTVVRCEKKPLPIALVAFFPFTFLWYYFERVRPRKHKPREIPAGERE